MIFILLGVNVCMVHCRHTGGVDYGVSFLALLARLHLV